MKKTSYLSAALVAVMCLLVVGCASTRTQESPGEYVSDTWITTKIKTALTADSIVKATEVNVETFKGAVQLSGFVTSKEAMDQAMVIANNVEGVTSVKNGMQVK